MSVQLALRKHDARLTAQAIQWWTHSSYSHCELVVEGLCYSSSAMDGGVRCKAIELDPAKWDVIDLPWADADRIKAYFAETDHLRYGWPSLATSQLFNLNRPIKGAMFCSEWCGAALGLPAPSSLNPHTLGLWAVFISSCLDLRFELEYKHS